MRNQREKAAVRILPQPAVSIDQLIEYSFSQHQKTANGYIYSFDQIKTYLCDNARIYQTQTTARRNQDFSQIIDYVSKLYHEANDLGLTNSFTHCHAMEITLLAQNSEFGILVYNNAKLNRHLNSHVLCVASRLATAFSNVILASQILEDIERLLKETHKTNDRSFLEKEKNSLTRFLVIQPPLLTQTVSPAQTVLVNVVSIQKTTTEQQSQANPRSLPEIKPAMQESSVPTAPLVQTGRFIHNPYSFISNRVMIKKPSSPGSQQSTIKPS